MKNKIIIINGPINSGKTTIGKLLQTQIDNSIFIDADDLIDWNKNVDLKEHWSKTIDLIIKKGNKITKQNKTAIFSYPISEKNFIKIKNTINAELIIITLSPKLKICLTNRGKRKLTDWELNRIKEHYKTGIHNAKYSNFIIDNSDLKPIETVGKIKDFLTK